MSVHHKQWMYDHVPQRTCEQTVNIIYKYMYINIYKSIYVCTKRNRLVIFVKSTKIRLYVPSLISYGFRTGIYEVRQNLYNLFEILVTMKYDLTVT